MYVAVSTVLYADSHDRWHAPSFVLAREAVCRLQVHVYGHIILHCMVGMVSPRVNQESPVTEQRKTGQKLVGRKLSSVPRFLRTNRTLRALQLAYRGSMYHSHLD